MYVYDRLIADGFDIDPRQPLGTNERWLLRRNQPHAFVASAGDIAPPCQECNHAAGDVRHRQVACRVIIDIENAGYEVDAFSGPMIHEWHAKFSDGTPRALVMAAVEAALAGQTDTDEDDDVVQHN